jgi:hypothetical protein
MNNFKQPILKNLVLGDSNILFDKAYPRLVCCKATKLVLQQSNALLLYNSKTVIHYIKFYHTLSNDKILFSGIKDISYIKI